MTDEKNTNPEVTTAVDVPPYEDAYIVEDEQGVLVWAMDPATGDQQIGTRFHSELLGKVVVRVRPVNGTAPAVEWRGQELPPEVQVARMRVAMFLGVAPATLIARDHTWNGLRVGAFSLHAEGVMDDWPFRFENQGVALPNGWTAEAVSNVTIGIRPPWPEEPEPEA